jgi:hypothetical protein
MARPPIPRIGNTNPGPATWPRPGNSGGNNSVTVLQELLSDKQPDEIIKTLARRYDRLAHNLKQWTTTGCSSCI